MSKRIITILVFALALSLFAGAAEISSADDMLTLMNTPSMWADDYTLTSDIDLSDATNGLSQAPIGTVDTPFTGTFDGDNHTISGIDVSGTTQIGLFGFVADGTIENLTIYGSVTATGNAVGGFVGHVDTASVTIQNCVNNCTVSGVDSVGGIIGRVETARSTVVISECINNGSISGARYVAGVAGLHSQTGGATTIEKCVNNGTVTASTAYAAGISAYWRVYETAQNKCFVQDCINNGSVSAGSSGYAGGIIAYGSNKNYVYTLTRCLNTGAITSSKYCRPIAGTVSAATNSAGNFSNCYYTSADTYTTDNYGVEVYVEGFDNAQSFSGLGESFILVNGYAPELKVFHTHEYKYVSVGTLHEYVCYCGDLSLTEEHSFTNGVCEKCGAEDVVCTHENKYEVIDVVATCSTLGSKHEYCPDCKAKLDVAEIPLDENNHSGTFAMALADGAVSYACSDCGTVVYTDSALLDTVYVSKNGIELCKSVTEQIGTEATPFKNFTDAMQYAAYCGKDVTVRILDNAEVPEKYVTPAFGDTITVSGGTLVTNGRFILEGAVSFDHVHFSNNNAIVIAAHENKLVMGEGITMSGGDVFLVGGYENGLDTNNDIPATGYSTDITLRSGLYHSVGGGNRFLGGAYSGTIKLTVGKTNSADTLIFDNTLVTASLNYDGGDNVKATFVLDGHVDEIVTFRPIVHPSAGVPGTFEVDLVVQGTAGVAAEDIHLRGPNYTLNVYADERVTGAYDLAAMIVGAEDVQPYKRYCIKVNGEHPDANKDKICDNCGASTECEHESGEWRETESANCVSGALYTWYCNDCQELIADMTSVGESVDADNHVSEDYTWQYADGVYSFTCTACGVKTEQSIAPTIYVSADGNDAYDGMTAKKAVASLSEAVSRMANVGGTVMIVGGYTPSKDIVLPAYNAPITFSGYDADDGYIVGGFKLSSTTVLSLGGETRFDNISFDGKACLIFECNWNDVEFGNIIALNSAFSHIVAGGYKITESDHEQKDVTLSITEGASSIVSKEGALSRNNFYANIYLGSSFGVDGISVSGKKVTFNATDAGIDVLYTMSTTGTYKNNPVSDCETVVNLYGDTVIEKGRTGDYNVGYADSTAALTKQTVNFFDNSRIGQSYYIRNAENTIINVSSSADGRTRALLIPFTFYAYGSFAESATAMNIELNCTSHSFVAGVTPLEFQSAAESIKVVTENVTDECEYISKVTKVATPSENGTVLYTCACGRSYTEEYAYSCADNSHVYLAKAEGGYECTVCGESLAYYVGDNTVAVRVSATEEDGVTASVAVKGEFAAALVNISIPAGYAFDSATLPSSDDLVISGSESEGVYTLAILSADGASKAVDIAFDMALAGMGEGIIEVAVLELYDGNGKALAATTVSTEIPETVVEVIVGDMDGDGILSVFDALAIVKAVVNNTFTEIADTNGDGSVSLVDVIRIFKMIVE